MSNLSKMAVKPALHAFVVRILLPIPVLQDVDTFAVSNVGLDG
jgi:hypothetical protein